MRTKMIEGGCERNVFIVSTFTPFQFQAECPKSDTHELPCNETVSDGGRRVANYLERVPFGTPFVTRDGQFPETVSRNTALLLFRATISVVRLLARHP